VGCHCHGHSGRFLLARHLHNSRRGAAAERASTRNTEKYSELSSTHLFTPLALETLGPINCEGLSFLSELGQKLRATTGEMRETAFLFQRISITIQRFNAVAFRGTFASQDTDEL